MNFVKRQVDGFLAKDDAGVDHQILVFREFRDGIQGNESLITTSGEAVERISAGVYNIVPDTVIRVITGV